MSKQCLFLNDREPYPQDCFDHIPGIEMHWAQDHSGGFSLVKSLEAHPDTQILITTLMDLNAENLARLPKLELIITITTGTDYIDKAYCEQHGIDIRNTPGFTGASVAEHAMALMLASAKRIADYNREIRNEDFQIFQYQGIELFGRQAGIIGMGAIGSQVARMLQGFGIKVVFCNRKPKDSDIATQVDMDTLLAESDIIFLTLSLNADSRHLINADTLAKVKPGAILINISPDELIDIAALDEALESGRLSYAGMDIHHEDERFLGLPNTILSPRRAWYTQDAFNRRIAIFTQTLADYVQEQAT
ncbi:2-hydroxyacid dehydrogenase [Thiothrix nivea]|uniref:D-isomer specific 2-hydroxyacid dehydrogenase NAD-binding n=1 Tax=Thiothrix nivea (strain ATCC 35100 / DSM 5205 / JP2) TaxID=870187 RepID=A0A656HIJ1_THINJ|nr:D-isomer specific 2-hydroxyacid dehydrogenase family protein [Thiothrix nivea]EIJ36811.1 D-isomer specific 2-hydroxyacid dehydrogenase NAD-binding [Thiothrix nivea DSM 5205]